MSTKRSFIICLNYSLILFDYIRPFSGGHHRSWRVKKFKRSVLNCLNNLSVTFTEHHAVRSDIFIPQYFKQSSWSQLIIELLIWRDNLLFLLYLTVVNASNGKFYWLQKFPFLFGRFHRWLNFLDIKIKNNNGRHEFDVHCKPAPTNVQKTRGANNNSIIIIARLTKSKQLPFLGYQKSKKYKSLDLK